MNRIARYLQDSFILILLFLVGGGIGILIKDDLSYFFVFGAIFCAVILVAHYFVKKF